MDSTGRRVVSVVFADLADFTALSERLDAEDVAGIQDAYFALAAAAVERNGGQVEKYIGDAVVATFGTVRADDTDPVRAVRAAREIAAGVGELGRRVGLPEDALRVRVGVDTGEVVVSRDPRGWRVTGDTMNTASRLQSAAAAGEVLLGPECAFGVTHAFAVEPCGELELKGKARPVSTWRVVAERTEPQRGLAAHGLRAPMLGRADEAAALRELVDRTGPGVSTGLLLVAPPGVGKSRLVEEVGADVEPHGHPTWRVRLGDEPDRGYPALARLMGSAGLPADPARLAEVVTPALRSAGYDDAHVAVTLRHTAALLAGDRLGAEPADLFPAWTAALDAAPAGAVPLLVVEDVHLAGADLRAFVAHALRHPGPRGRLVVLTGRPTAGLDAWLGLVPVTHLEPLDPPTTRELVRHLLAGAVPDDYAEGIVAASGGNPLFVEELVRSWIQTGLLVPDGEGWVLRDGAGRPALPSTVHAIYQGQLDALGRGTRHVVERGSVPGITFPVDALPVLGAPDPADPLDELTRGGLLRGPHAHPVGPRAYTYRHALLRDTAYGSLSRRERAELHVRFARWLAYPAEPGTARTETVAEHLALAVDVLPATAAGLADGTTTASLAEDAAAWLERAAGEHLVSSPQRAGTLLRRALDLPGGSVGADRLRRRLALAEAERRSGRLPEAMAEFAAAGDAARARDDAAALVAAALGYEDALFASRLPRTEWGGRSLELLRAAETALAPAVTATRSRVLASLGRALTYSGEHAAGAEACSLAVELAADDPTALAQALLAGRVALDGPENLGDRLASTTRAVEAAARGEDLELRLEANRLAMVDLLELGDMAGADAAQARATDLVQALGRPLFLWYPPMWRAMRALLAGDVEDGEHLIEDFSAQARRAHYADAPMVRTILRMRLCLDTGRESDALPEVLAMAEAFPDRWQFAPAVVLARLGDHVGAREALDHYARQDFANLATDLAFAATACYLAEAARLVGDARSCGLLAERLAPWAGHVVVIGSGALCLGSASLFLGQALLGSGQVDAGRAALEEAARQDDAIGARALAAQARHLLRSLDGAGPGTVG